VSWFQVFLILHILAVFVAFGPEFAFPLIGRQIEKNPEHAAFGVQIMNAIEEKMSTPLAVIVPLLGVALIYTGHFDLWKSTWLVITVILYPIVFFFALFVQTPAGNKLLAMMLEMQKAGPPPEGAAGPPPELQAQLKRVRLGGMFLGLMVVFFVILMVWKPGNG
jgi:predicted integral membrane protein DUF2269